MLTTAFAHIADAVREIADGSRGPLDVACFSTFTVKWLIPRLFDFQARHPGIEVRLRTTDAGTGATSTGCDACITAEESHADREAAAHRLLFPEHLGPVLSPALAERVALSQTTDIVSPARASLLLHTRTRRNAWAMWAAAVGTDTPALATGPEFEHYYFTLEAAVRGLGVAVAPWHLVMDDVQAGRLVAPLGFAASGYHYVLRRREGSHPRLDVFCAWLEAQAGATPRPPVAP